MTYPEWWPNGVDESICRDCNCEYCAELIERLEEYREQQSADGTNTPLSVF